MTEQPDPNAQMQEDAARVLGFLTQDLDNYIVRTFGDAVQSGPFTGLRLVEKAPGGFLTLYYTGSFEMELHATFERLFTRSYTQAVNVGGSEGFYAIGLALRLPGISVVTFEAEPLLHPIIRANAAANGVDDRLDIRGLCAPADLQEVLRDNALIVMDCEGCEVETLDPQRIPALKTATIVVELHDCYRPEASRDIPPRFAATHTVDIIEVQGRDVTQIPALAAMPQLQQYLSVCEFRPPNVRWGVFTPKT